MGKLSGFTYREVIRKLKKIGFEFYRTGKGDHEIWFNPQTRLKTTIPHHKEIREGTLHNILKQCQVGIDEFLIGQLLKKYSKIMLTSSTLIAKFKSN